MKPHFYILAVLTFAAQLHAQEALSQDTMNKLKERPDLLSAWKTLSDESITSPVEIRRNVSKLMASGDDSIRLLLITHKPDDVIFYLQSSPPPTLADSAFLAQAMLASSVSNQPTPGGEEQASQRGMVLKLSLMLKKSLSTVDAAAPEINWEGESQAELVRWLQALSKALVDDPRISQAQRAAAMKIQDHIQPLLMPK